MLVSVQMPLSRPEEERASFCLKKSVFLYFFQNYFIYVCINLDA